MPIQRLILFAALASPLVLSGAPALAQQDPDDNPPAYQLEDASPTSSPDTDADAAPDTGPDAGAPSLAILLGSDSDALALADADVDHRIDLRAGDGSLTGEQADTVRADLEAIRGDAAEELSDNGGVLTGAQRDELQARLRDLGEQVDALSENSAPGG